TGSATQQCVIEAEGEIGRPQERQVSLERQQPIAVARINTLLHLPPDAPLPPPPEKLRLGETLPEAAALRERALAARPDLRALADRVRAEQASLGLAHKEFCPDFQVMAPHHTIWHQKPPLPHLPLP